MIMTDLHNAYFSAFRPIWWYSQSEFSKAWTHHHDTMLAAVNSDDSVAGVDEIAHEMLKDAILAFAAFGSYERLVGGRPIGFIIRSYHASDKIRLTDAGVLFFHDSTKKIHIMQITYPINAIVIKVPSLMADMHETATVGDKVKFVAFNNHQQIDIQDALSAYAALEEL